MNAINDTIASVTDALRNTIEKHQRIALMYSGGLESSLLLHLARPWRDNVRVYHVRTDSALPHMVSFVDHVLAEWDYRIVTVDVAASFRDFGIPAYDHAPGKHVQGVTEASIYERRPFITFWPACCSKNRNIPCWEAIISDGTKARAHGTRKRFRR